MEEKFRTVVEEKKKKGRRGGKVNRTFDRGSKSFGELKGPPA